MRFRQSRAEITQRKIAIFYNSAFQMRFLLLAITSCFTRRFTLTSVMKIAVVDSYGAFLMLRPGEHLLGGVA